MNMKRDDAFQKSLYQHAGLFRASGAQLKASEQRVREHLEWREETALGETTAANVPARSAGRGWVLGLSVAAAAILIAFVLTPGWGRGESLAIIATADGSISGRAGDTSHAAHLGNAVRLTDVVRADAGAVLSLTDGSRIEMREGSELSLERAEDGITIRLLTGDIIVNAAKQRDGHLYVRTKDVTVSVVGTVFLVNAEPDGSHVGVIEGEVRVREGTMETRLHPGEQVSTVGARINRSLRDEIAWSRNANAHLAILASFTKGMADTSGPLTALNDASGAHANQDPARASVAAFEVASIRQCDQDSLPGAPEGARGGGANSIRMTPGRTYVLCMTLATIIRTAYGYGPVNLEFMKPTSRGIGPVGEGLKVDNVYGLGVEDGRRVRGGPSWVRDERYTIEASAGTAADAETMRGPMLLALLEKRFKLKAHIETEEVPAFDLVEARGGLKIKPVGPDACEPMPPFDGPAIRRPRTVEEVRRGARPTCGTYGDARGQNQVFLIGGGTIGGLGRMLGGPLGQVRVTDKTGITDKFNIILEFAWDENTPGRRVVMSTPEESASIPLAATIFTALEEQLGLKLVKSRTPREFIVIDHVERPAPDGPLSVRSALSRAKGPGR
jgi:uncharacterized protein (TIGR03435 family)